MTWNESQALFERARQRITGGVNSPSRSYAAVGGDAPVFTARGEGAYLYDVDGNRYIDYLASYGALILGHAHPRIVEAVRRQIQDGSVYGTPTPGEVSMAERLHAAIPGLERVRFTASGTEAVMTALRVARGYTNRHKILKFDGAYHGHADPVLVSAGSGSSTLGIDESLGVTPGVANDVISIPYDDIPKLRQAFDESGAEIAAVLVEPVTGNFGIVVPQRDFLAEISRLAKASGALVIWDEVITAFRFQYGSVGLHFDLKPDLYTLGKIIGGGLPMGAYGGRAEVMEIVAPSGGVYQDGTLSGNPLSVAAGNACLDELAAPGFYEPIERRAQRLEEGIDEAARRRGVTMCVRRFGGALSPFFSPKPPNNFAETEATCSRRFARFFQLLLERGVMTAPSKYEAWFVTAAHSDDDIDRTLEAVDGALAQMAREGLS